MNYVRCNGLLFTWLFSETLTLKSLRVLVLLQRATYCDHVAILRVEARLSCYLTAPQQRMDSVLCKGIAFSSLKLNEV